MIFAEIHQYWWLIFLLIFITFIFGRYRKIRVKNQKNPLVFWNRNVEFSVNNMNRNGILIILGIVFLCLAVFRPQWGESIQTTRKKGLDIVFAVDVSKSMNALDFSQKNQKISRLDATKYLIESFLEKRKTDRIGLVEFAGESFVASPLTLDYHVFLNFLKNISSNDLGVQGTNIADALDVSLARLEVQSETKNGKAIVLFSDGEETINSQAKKMAELAKKRNIPIFTIGIGSEKGQPIPEGQDVFGRIKYKTYKGKTVLAKLNPEPLQQIAKITDGEYFHAEKISDLRSLQKKLETLPQKILKDESISPKNDQYFWFAVIGLFLFSLGFLFPEYSLFSKNYF